MISTELFTIEYFQWKSHNREHTILRIKTPALLIFIVVHRLVKRRKKIERTTLLQTSSDIA